jgi:hypothetical protein
MPANQRAKARSELVRVALTGAWRDSPMPLEMSEQEVSDVIPLLLRSGAGGLGWWRARVSNPWCLELRQAYRFHTIRAAYYEHQIKRVFSFLRSEQIEPVLVKGWSISRLYPSKGLRPYGDIDICVRPDQYKRAKALLESSESEYYPLDLHEGSLRLDARSADDLFAGTQLVALGEAEIRILAPEDLLRVVCVHLLRHGAWRPLWLCDVALLVESRAASFDWGRCLSHDRRLADWIGCAIGLSNLLLQTDVRDVPVAKKMPRWLVTSVLKHWDAPYLSTNSPMKHRAPIAGYFHHPRGVLEDLLRRWPGAIEATIHMNGRFNRVPRWPFQVGHSFTRAARFCLSLTRSDTEADP